MGVSVKGSGGGGLSSTDVTASSAQVLAGYTALTTDSNDDAMQGTIQTWNGTHSLSCLCFTANTAGSTISMSVTGTPRGTNFQTSTDGINWVTFTPGTTEITLTNVGDEVYFKGANATGLSSDSSAYYTFSMTGSISASGNIMSLIDNGACNTTVIPNDYCFYGLFKNCTALTTPPATPATTLKGSCYSRMF